MPYRLAGKCVQARRDGGAWEDVPGGCHATVAEAKQHLGGLTIAEAREKAKPPTSWSFDVDAQRYRWPNTGRLVPYVRVKGLVERRQADARKDMAAHTKALLDGRMTPDAWRDAMRGTIRSVHVQLRVVGAGGPDQMTPREYGRLGASLKREYKYLDAFARDIAAGNLSNAEIALRASMYGGASVLGEYEKARHFAHKGAAYDEKRRVPMGDERVCATCVREAARGWVPIDEPGFVLGATECKTGDRCGFEYRRRPAE